MKTLTLTILLAATVLHGGAGDHIPSGAGSKVVVMTNPVKGK